MDLFIIYGTSIFLSLPITMEIRILKVIINKTSVTVDCRP